MLVNIHKRVKISSKLVSFLRSRGVYPKFLRTAYNFHKKKLNTEGFERHIRDVDTGFHWASTEDGQQYWSQWQELYRAALANDEVVGYTEDMVLKYSELACPEFFGEVAHPRRTDKIL